MALNAVAPWEGELIWKGEVNENGKWKSIDFTLKYTNSKMEEEYITFNAFGEDKVNQVLSYADGTMLRVVWWPKANEAKSSGKWYSRNNAISIGLATSEVKSADTKVKAPNFSGNGTTMPLGPSGPSFPDYNKPSEPWKNEYTPIASEEDLPDDAGLPF